MRSQDDITFASQQFANEVGARRDRIAETQIGLNLQAGQLSGQFVDAYRAQQQFDMQQASDATQLASDELKLQQAREEFAWAQELKKGKLLSNMRSRDDAVTALEIAKADKARMELAGFDPSTASDPMSMAGLIASGIFPQYDTAKGDNPWTLRESTAEEKKTALDFYNKKYTERYGARTANYSPRLEISRLLDNIRSATAAGEKDIAKKLKEELRSMYGVDADSEDTGTRQTGGPSAPSGASQDVWQHPAWSGFDDAGRETISNAVTDFARVFAADNNIQDLGMAQRFVMETAETNPSVMALMLSLAGANDEDVMMKLRVLFPGLEKSGMDGVISDFNRLRSELSAKRGAKK